VPEQNTSSREFDSDGNRLKSKDKYEFLPPPDEERYTQGMPPEEKDDEAAQPVSSGAGSDQYEDCTTDSQAYEPTFIEGTVRRGGKWHTSPRTQIPKP
jgi:hypothetical protein